MIEMDLASCGWVWLGPFGRVAVIYAAGVSL